MYLIFFNKLVEERFSMIYHFILNPKSGRSPRQKNLEQTIKLACKKRQLNYHIYDTTAIGDATEYVRSMVRISQERQRFICVGGDGTINEIANSVPGNPNAEFGVIPCGSGNDFVRNFTNTKTFLDVEAQIDGEAHRLDLIKCNDLYCVNMVNIGFDCAVVKEADKAKKYVRWLSPGLSYIVGIVAVLFQKFGMRMKLIFDDGEVLDQEFTLTAIGNGKFCGGGFMAQPKALLRDGIMDVCAINKVTRLNFFTLVGSYKNGTYLENKHASKFFRHIRTDHFRMEFETPISICIDGEIEEAQKIDFKVVPGAFNFVIPKGCELKYDICDKDN